MNRLGAVPLALLWALPLLLSLALLVPTAVDGAAWTLALAHPQLWPALALALATGGLSTLIALAISLLLLGGLSRSHAWSRLQGVAAAGLAIPHLAFAIGFAFLVMPSGLIARLLVGGDAPPQWVSVHTESRVAPAGPSGRALASTGSSGAERMLATAPGLISTTSSLDTVHCPRPQRS